MRLSTRRRRLVADAGAGCRWGDCVASSSTHSSGVFAFFSSSRALVFVSRLRFFAALRLRRRPSVGDGGERQAQGLRRDGDRAEREQGDEQGRRSFCIPPSIGLRRVALGPRTVQHALELQQRLLHRQAAAVAAERAAGAQDAVAGDDERDRVAAAGGAGGADRALVAGAASPSRCSCGSGRRGCGRSPAAPAGGSRSLSRQSSGRSKSVELALEVEVELAARLVELGRAPRAPAGRPASARSTSSSSASWFGRPTRTRPRRRLRQQQRAEGRVGGRVGDVEQALLGGPRSASRSSAVVAASCQLLSQSLQSLVQAAPRRLRRAAEGGGDLGVGEVAGVAQGHRGALLRRQRADRLPDARRRAPAGRSRPPTSGTSATGIGRRPLARWWSIALRWAIVSSQPRRLRASLSFG